MTGRVRRRLSLTRWLYSVLMFVLVSALGGVLLAGLLVPFAGFAAEVGKQVAGSLDAVPEELKVGPPAEGSTVLLSDGSVLTSFYDQYRKNVTLDQVSPYMRMAQYGIEDQRFYEHGALDLKGTLRALVRSSSGQAQGGSTLTQQYVKLALLYDAAARNDAQGVEDANSRTVSRKVLELRYAIALEKQLTKDQILERYLNIAFYGDKAYGVEAAAQHYFGVAAKDLSLPQAAMLAGIVRNPVTTNPIANEAAATERMRNVLDRLSSSDLKFITPQQAAEAKTYKFDKTKVKKIEPRGCSISKYPHLCDYVTQVLLDQTTSLGADPTARQVALNHAGLKIQTNIDPRFQDAAQQAVSNFIAPTDPVIGIMTMVQPGTGRILAMAQSRPALGGDTAKGETFLNYAVENSANGAGGTEGGSTFKAFTLVAALQQGVEPQRDFIQSDVTKEYPEGANWGLCSGQKGAYYKSTQAGAVGNFNMYLGATYSSNTFFTQLEQKVGVCNVVKAAQQLGLRRADGANLVTGILPSGKHVVGPADGDKPTFTVGNSAVTAVSITNAYATLAARGKRCDPVILDKITDSKGHEYAVPSANCQQVIKPEIADRVNDILHGPFSYEGTLEKAVIPGYLLSGKTGTQTKAPTILAAGFTPDYAGLAIITSDAKHPEAIANKQAAGIDVGLPPLAGLKVHGARIEAAMTPHSLDYSNYPTKDGFALPELSGTIAGGSVWKPATQQVLPLLPRTGFIRPTDSPYSQAATNDDISALQTSGRAPTADNPNPGAATQPANPGPSTTPSP